MKKFIFLITITCLQIIGYGQYLAAYNDYLQRFWAFEAGTFKQLEHLEIQEFQVGGIVIAYIDNGSNLKVYRNGEVENLMQGAPIKFEATDYLLGYSMYEQLNVYDNGNKQVLSTSCDGYIIKDSLIAWHDRIQNTIDVYYNGQTTTILDGLIYNPLGKFKAGDNTLAFVHTSSKSFYLFYLGELQILDDFVQELRFEAGRDIVAYIDVPDQAFYVFFRGEIIELESFAPKSFHVGDEIVAWVDNLGKLKLFDNGEITILSTYEPKYYYVNDRVLVFEEQGFFKTYCNGEIYVIERYEPQPYILDYNTIAYLDQNRFVKVFQNCESKPISFIPVKEISLIRDLVIYVEGVNKTKIYFNGEVYEYLK